jgi:hypothetical protein
MFIFLKLLFDLLFPLLQWRSKRKTLDGVMASVVVVIVVIMLIRIFSKTTTAIILAIHVVFMFDNGSVALESMHR